MKLMDMPSAENQLPAKQKRRWQSFIGEEIIVLLAFAALIVAAYFWADFSKQLGPPERCWEVQEVDGKLYKANPCTGQFLLLGDVPTRSQP